MTLNGMRTDHHQPIGMTLLIMLTMSPPWKYAFKNNYR